MYACRFCVPQKTADQELCGDEVTRRNISRIFFLSVITNDAFWVQLLQLCSFARFNFLRHAQAQNKPACLSSCQSAISVLRLLACCAQPLYRSWSSSSKQTQTRGSICARRCPTGFLHSTAASSPPPFCKSCMIRCPVTTLSFLSPRRKGGSKSGRKFHSGRSSFSQLAYFA